MTPSMSRRLVEIVGLNKWFGAMHALRNVDLAVGAGERIVVCGPSGSGKSTMVRCINALERFQPGRSDWKETRSTPIATASSWSGVPSAWSSSRSTFSRTFRSSTTSRWVRASSCGCHELRRRAQRWSCCPGFAWQIKPGRRHRGSRGAAAASRDRAGAGDEPQAHAVR